MPLAPPSFLRLTRASTAWAAAPLLVACTWFACSSDGGDTTATGPGGVGGSTTTTTGSQVTSSATTASVTSSSSTGNPALPPELACVGSVDWQPPESDPLDIGGKLGVFPNEAPIDGATVRACAAGDAPCAAPLDESTTAADGLYALTVAGGTVGFDGYLEITGPNLLSDLVYWLPPVRQSTSSHQFLEITVASYDGLLSDAGLTRDPARGQVAVTSFDCSSAPIAGIAFSLDVADAATTLGYFVGPNLDVLGTATDDSGFAIFVNAPPGPANVTATHVASGLEIASWDIDVRADHVTSLFLAPTP